jgi:hypothetical protein
MVITMEETFNYSPENILIQKLFGTHNFLLYLLNFFELYNHWIYNFNLNKQIYS